MQGEGTVNFLKFHHGSMRSVAFSPTVSTVTLSLVLCKIPFTFKLKNI